MIERLRDTPAWIPELSLVAEVDSAIVGRILLTKAVIVDGSGAVTTLALAPLSIVPAFQRAGIGGQLVQAAHNRVAELGYDSIVLVGIPDYYPRFGYLPLSQYPITLPFEAPPQNCLILPLWAEALNGVRGVVRYADGWLAD